MFTFVIWAIGLAIMGWMALMNLNLIAFAFEIHWFWGLLTIGASLIGRILLLLMVL